MLLREQVTQLKQEANRLVVDWADGHHSVFHYIWLRDNCSCALCRHPNGQRLLDTAAIPEGVAPAHVSRTGGQAIGIEWAPDGHRSEYTPAWLRAHCYSASARPERRAAPTLWGAEMAGHLPRADYGAIARDEGALRDWLAAIERYGFALLHGVPARPGMVLDVVKLFGYVRETNYGLLFDVKSVVNPNNLAYTGLGLGETVGMPVPGTCTSVWWERLQDKDLVFGIPEVGMLDIHGNLMENEHLAPTYMVEPDPSVVAAGRDQQVEKAAQVLLGKLPKK